MFIHFIIKSRDIFINLRKYKKCFTFHKKFLSVITYFSEKAAVTGEWD